MKTELMRGARRVAARAYDDGRLVVSRSGLSRAPAVAVMMMLMVTAAHAQVTGITGGASASTMLTDIANFILGAFGQTLAVLAIIGIGLAWMFGRVSLGLIAGVIGGIIIMFGASYLASTLIGGGGGAT